MNFTQKQYELIFAAVRRWQIEKTILNSSEYQECSVILDELFDSVYTQRVEQPTWLWDDQRKVNKHLQ